MNKLAAPNHALLRGAALVLAGISEDERVLYYPSVTVNGAQGHAHASFHTEPLFLGCWPSPPSPSKANNPARIHGASEARSRGTSHT